MQMDYFLQSSYEFILIMHPLQAAIQNNVQADHETGNIMVSDFFTGTALRVGLADRYLLQAMLTVIPTETDTEKIYEEFYDLGRSWGGRFYDTLQQRINANPPDSVRSPKDYFKDEFVEHLNGYFSYCGLGQFRIHEANHFYVIELKNPWHFPDDAGNAYLIVLLAGFFAELFGRIGEQTLACTALSVSDDAYRFAISRDAVIQEIRAMFAAGKQEEDVLTHFQNDHLL